MALDDSASIPQAAPCPICGKPAVRAHRPFCSPRCRDIDLGRWLRGVYRVETDEPPENENAGEAG